MMYNNITFKFNIVNDYISTFKVNYFQAGYNIRIKILVLHVADPNWIPCMAKHPLSTFRSNPWVQSQE